VPLLVESAASESLQKLFASICGQIGVRVCRCDVCNRPAFSLLHWGCQKGVGLALMQPAENRRHSHDLSAVVDLVSHGGEEVGFFRKQLAKVGHHAVLIDEGVGIEVEVGVQGASHHLALVVNAAGYGGMISQSAEVLDCAVLPKSGSEG